MCQVARFYSWGFEEIMKMPSDKFWKFHRAIERLRSQEFLFDLQSSDYPHAKENDRKRVYKATRHGAFPEERKILTFDKIGEVLSGRI